MWHVSQCKVPAEPCPDLAEGLKGEQGSQSFPIVSSLLIQDNNITPLVPSGVGLTNL